MCLPAHRSPNKLRCTEQLHRGCRVPLVAQLWRLGVVSAMEILLVFTTEEESVGIIGLNIKIHENLMSQTSSRCWIIIFPIRNLNIKYIKCYCPPIWDNLKIWISRMDFNLLKSRRFNGKDGKGCKGLRRISTCFPSKGGHGEMLWCYGADDHTTSVTSIAPRRQCQVRSWEGDIFSTSGASGSAATLGAPDPGGALGLRAAGAAGAGAAGPGDGAGEGDGAGPGLQQDPHHAPLAELHGNFNGVHWRHLDLRPRGNPKPLLKRNPIFRGCKIWTILNKMHKISTHLHKSPKSYKIHEWLIETSRAVHILKSMSIQEGSQQLRALQHGSSSISIHITGDHIWPKWAAKTWWQLRISGAYATCEQGEVGIGRSIFASYIQQQSLFVFDHGNKRRSMEMEVKFVFVFLCMYIYI